MLTRLVIGHFRGIVREVALDLRDMTLLAGRNGLGKTTIFDAIDWCLFGNGSRDADEVYALRNLYVPADPYVEVTLELGDERHIVQRDPAGARLNGVRVDDRDLLDLFPTDPGIFPPYTRDRSQRIRRLIYLPQDEIRALVGSEGRDERAVVLQAILGVPDAQLVMSSVRRVEGRMAERRESVSTSLAETQSAIQELLVSTSGVRVATTPDVESTLAYAREALGIQGDAPLSMVELLRDIRERQRALASERRRLEDLRVTMAENGSRRRSVGELLRRDEVDLLSKTHALATAEETLRQATAAREIARSTYTGHQTAADAVLIDVDGLRRSAARLETADDLRRSLMADTEALRRVTADLAIVSTRVAAAEEVVSTAFARAQLRRNELGRLQTTRQRLQEKTAVASAVTRAHREHSEVESALATHAERTASLQEAIGAGEADLRTLRARIGALKLSRAERIDILLRELEGFTLSMPTQHSCLLCGTAYDSHAELASAIRQAAVLRAEQSAEVETVTNRLNAVATSLAAKRDQMASAEADMITSRQRRDSLAREISTLSARLASYDEIPQQTALESGLVEVTAELRSDEHAEEIARGNLGAVQGELALLEVEAQRLRESIAAAESRLATLGLSISADLDQMRADIQAKIVAAEAKYGVLAQEAARAEQHLGHAASAEREAVQAVQGARVDVAAMEARVAEYRVSLQRLQTEYTDTARRALRLRVDDGLDIDTIIDENLRRIQERSNVLKAVEIRLDTLVTFLEQENRGRRLQDLRAEEGRLVQELEELDRAANRFGGISRSLRDAAKGEGGKAVERLQGVVQYLFDAIYPHRHLNQVVLKDDPAEAFLSDTQLSEAVRADLYTSTGQLSVLGLCVLVGASLRQRAIRLNLLLLDEPVQSLDDLHFLGFITLVRRIALTRQVIMSTADANVAELFRRQMKSSALGMDGGYIQYEWREFEAGVGPQIERVAG